jgi:hypothetical protein
MSDQEDAVIPGYAAPLIDPARIDEIMRDCLAKDASAPDVIVVEGVVHNYAFQPAKLAEHKLDVAAMLVELPMEFRPVPMGGGGGWSFLNACNDRRGEQWTGMHLVMEGLFVLGIAMDLAAWLLPKDMWPALPGGMPYVAVKV